VAVLANVESIRDVIAFPKTQKGTCLLTDAPTPVSPAQLRELAIEVVLPSPPPASAPGGAGVSA